MTCKMTCKHVQCKAMHLRKIADRFVEVSPQLSEYLARATPRQCGVAKSVASAGLDPFDVARRCPHCSSETHGSRTTRRPTSQSLTSPDQSFLGTMTISGIPSCSVEMTVPLCAT